MTAGVSGDKRRRTVFTAVRSTSSGRCAAAHSDVSDVRGGEVRRDDRGRKQQQRGAAPA